MRKPRKEYIHLCVDKRLADVIEQVRIKVGGKNASHTAERLFELAYDSLTVLIMWGEVSQSHRIHSNAVQSQPDVSERNENIQNISHVEQIRGAAEFHTALNAL